MNLKNNFLYTGLRSIVRYLRVVKTFHADIYRYYKYSMMVSNNEAEKLKSLIIMDAHVIEKGITMPNSRLGFGQPRIKQLMKNLTTYVKNYGFDTKIKMGIEVVLEYFDIHNSQSYELNSDLKNIFDELQVLLNESDVIQSSQPDMTKENYFSDVDNSFKKFSDSRKSLRNFTGQTVDSNLIIEAIDNARNAPSACNRQGARIHLYSEKKQIEEILTIQGGNRGFGHLCSHVIAITFESKCYFEEVERYLGYVDGGIFAMNLLYHLHALKIGACILNASNTNKKEKAMRNSTKVSDSEFFVSYIVIGELPENFKYAASHRFALDKYLTVH